MEGTTEMMSSYELRVLLETGIPKLQPVTPARVKRPRYVKVRGLPLYRYSSRLQQQRQGQGLAMTEVASNVESMVQALKGLNKQWQRASLST